MKPEDLQYTKTHEWIHLAKDDSGASIATIGITAFALEALTDLVFVDLPDEGTAVTRGEAFGEIESVKAVSELYSPFDGEIVEVNEELADHLDTLSDDPYGKGWFARIRLSDTTGLDALLSPEEYKKLCREESH